VSLTLLSLIATVACADRAPARLTGAFGDTLVVHSPDPTRLTPRAEDASGRGARVRDAYWQLVGEAPFTLSADGTVHCTRAGDGRVDVSRGAARARLVVRCRPIIGVRPLGIASLTVGGPPAAFALQAVGLQREPVTEIAASATVLDTSVAVLRDGLVYPKGRGVTRLEVALPHCVSSARIEVLERVAAPDALEASQQFEDTLTLVPEEIRSWTLRPNLYVFELEADSAAQASLAFDAPGFNCARWSDVPRGLSCLARAPARVVVRHTGAPSPTARAVIRMRVANAPHPDSSDARTRIAQESAAQNARRRLPACPVVL
jgi:hypothetical protein